MVTVELVHTWDEETNGYCTGVWIAPKIIATANHCMNSAAERLSQEEVIRQIVAKTGLTIGQVLLQMRAGDLGLPDVMPYIDKMTMDVSMAAYGDIEVTDSPVLLEEKNTMHGRVLALLPSHDLALIQVLSGDVKEHGIAPLAKEIVIGETCHVVGGPNDFYWTHSGGIVAAWREAFPGIEGAGDLRGPFVQISAAVYYGSSGGGAFNDKGELIGIISFMGKMPNSGFLIPASELKALMAGMRLIKLDTTTPPYHA
jgi:hypothetical protein